MFRTTVPYLFSLAILCGCAGLAPGLRGTPGEKDVFSSFPEKYGNQALQYEEQGELRKALFSWQIVASFKPDDHRASQHIEALKLRIRSEADKHLSQGLKYLRNNLPQAAGVEFLHVLFYDPDQVQALDYLRRLSSEADYKFYETAAGDTPSKIAREEYGDSGMDFLVVYFNDLARNNVLQAGLTLKLPIIASVLTAEQTYPEEMLKMARVMFEAREYQKALSMAQDILAYDPANSEATELIKASSYELGRVLLRQRKYSAALRRFQNLDPDYRNAGDIVNFLEKNMHNRAEAHYKKGVTYYLHQELDKAIGEWQETLQLNPHHPRARQDLRKAQRLLEKLKELQ